MSSLKMRSEDSVRVPVLASLLQHIGITVPDQSKVPHMMEATRIGLLPSVSPRRLKIAWFRRWRSQGTPFCVYTFDEFTKKKFVDGKICAIGDSWGGLPPDPVRKDVELIKKHIPEAGHFVHATREDPWHEVRLGSESVFIHCWMTNWNMEVKLHI